MLLVVQQQNIDRSSTLYIFEGPFKLLHGDIADIRFLAKSAVDPKYCLFFVFLFISKIHNYPLKNESLLSKKNRIDLRWN